MARVYLDNAATTWPKNARAVEAAQAFIRDCGATAGRGTYRSAQEAQRWLQDARVELAKLVNAASSQDVAICSSGTHALNAALYGILRPGDHVITTSIEHNSLLRPLKQLESSLGVRITVVESDGDGYAQAQQAVPHLCDQTKLIAIGHASNVTGKVQDLRSWGQLAGAAGARFLVDASQTLGYVPLDISAGGIDLLAAAGHKGLGALAGTGLLVVARDLQTDFRPLMLGGTGLASEQLTGGQAWPSSVEVGNLNMPGVVSLAIAARECLVAQAAKSPWLPSFERLVRGLFEIPEIELIGWSDGLNFEQRIPLVSLRMAGWQPHDLASVLDASFGIEARAGWHCAALVHATLGTAVEGGTLRLSPGVSTTMAEIDYTLYALKQMVG